MLMDLHVRLVREEAFAPEGLQQQLCAYLVALAWTRSAHWPAMQLHALPRRAVACSHRVVLPCARMVHTVPVVTSRPAGTVQ